MTRPAVTQLFTRLLASVRDAAEAETVLSSGADIVDLKDPTKGALGAVAPDTVRACIARVSGRKPVSATVGDLPMAPRSVSEAVMETAYLGVDDVKLGILPGGDPGRCFAHLRQLDLPAGLILVFFADAMPAFDPIGAAKAAGARGIMLDTARKEAGPLTEHMDMAAISRFVEAGRRASLLVGLAGSLRAVHIRMLLDCRPDVIGLRGALCRNTDRSSALDPVACREIRSLIPKRFDATEAGFRQPNAASVC